jgi:hypothetical protein
MNQPDDNRPFDFADKVVMTACAIAAMAFLAITILG